MHFEHPLARSAKVWQAKLQNGDSHSILVVVTTLELDPKAKKYKPDLVSKLEDKARAFLVENPEKAMGMMLVNRSKDW